MVSLIQFHIQGTCNVTCPSRSSSLFCAMFFWFVNWVSVVFSVLNSDWNILIFIIQNHSTVISPVDCEFLSSWLISDIRAPELLSPAPSSPGAEPVSPWPSPPAPGCCTLICWRSQHPLNQSEISIVSYQPIRDKYYIPSTNQRLLLYCVNQSKISIVLCQPNRDEY